MPAEIIYCKDCEYSTCYRSGEVAKKYGKGMQCSLNIITCPDDYDFCSMSKKILRCPKCNTRFDKFPNFCPNCGTDMKEVEK